MPFAVVALVGALLVGVFDAEDACVVRLFLRRRRASLGSSCPSGLVELLLLLDILLFLLFSCGVAEWKYLEGGRAGGGKRRALS